MGCRNLRRFAHQSAADMKPEQHRWVQDPNTNIWATPSKAVFKRLSCFKCFSMVRYRSSLLETPEAGAWRSGIVAGLF